MGIRDDKAPKVLQVILLGENNQEWGRLYATPKEFSTGSVGFYANGKLINPVNPECRYQSALTLTLIGSKDKKSGTD
ncbi:MAG: hypothetical protein LBD29_01190 [Treponema sp.]|jgi:hypothetical protein|nr:hypothetical protein [Treponema sp.]